MQKMTERFKAYRIRWGRRAVSALLCLAALCTLLPPAKADETSTGNTLVNNAGGDQYYALQVSTGNSDGHNVLYFTVRYQDAKGVNRAEVIYPGFEALKKSYEIARQLGGATGDMVTTKNTTMKDFAFGIKDDAKVDVGNVAGLQKNSTDTYLFKPHFVMKKLIGVDIMVRCEAGTSSAIASQNAQKSDNENNGWSCGGLEIYRVKEVKGLDMISGYNKNILVRYSGELIGELSTKENVTYSVNGNIDRVFRLRVPKNAADKYGAEVLAVYDDATAATKQYNTSDPYMLAINFADFRNAGVETHRKNATLDGYLTEPESLVARISYRDLSGWIMNVDVPVMTSMLCYLLTNAQTITDSKDEKTRLPYIFDMGQQGETVYAPVYLQGIDRSVEPTVSLFYGTKKAAELCSLNYEAESANKQTNISVSSVQIFGSFGGLTIDEQKSTITVADLGNPLWFFASPTVQGTQMAQNVENKLKMLTYRPGESALAATDPSTYYMVELETDSTINSGTSDTLNMRFNFTSTLGDMRAVDVNLREAVEEFYGRDNPSSYEQHLATGATARFLFSATDVRQFESVEIKVEGGGDSYQFTDLRIYPVSYRGKRTFEFKEKGSRIYWEVERDIQYNPQNIAVNFSATHVMVYKGTTQVVKFGQTAGDVVIQNEVNWADYRVSMSYSDAMQNMGYTDIRATYLVKVKVGSDTGEITDNGDTGSENKFYFQLIFDGNKTSAYVLANQLIASGRFRAGETETFNIRMNYDYGDVKAVRLIPDDTISEDESFDKLYVDYVTVVKSNSGIGISKTWTANVRDWIDIDYVDAGVRNSVSGQDGRKEGQLARTYNITSTSFETDFIVEIKTGTYDHGDNVGIASQFDGVLFADFEYTSRDGTVRHYTIDVFDAMREHMLLDSTGTATNLPEKMSELKLSSKLSGQKINKEFMLTPYSADRFKISLTNARKINSVMFYGSHTGTGQCYWTIDWVKIYRITGGSDTLYLNEWGKPDRDFETILLDQSLLSSYQMVLPSEGTCQEQPVGFSGEEIPLNEAEGTWTTLIGKEPDSLNDELNIYIYMQETFGEEYLPTTPITQYGMSVSVSYCYDDAYGGHYTNGENGVSTMSRDTEKNAFYVRGLSASGISSINGLVIEARDPEKPNKKANYNVGAYVRKVVVEQVRSGVAITSYAYGFINPLEADANSASGSLKVYSGLNPKLDTKVGKQTVYLQLGAGTESFYPKYNGESWEISDVAVALEYHTSNMADPNDSVRTKNIFFSEVCGENLVEENDVIKLEFDAPYLDSIVGVQLVSLGDISVTVSGVSVGVEQEREISVLGNDGKTTTKTETSTMWYGTTNTSVIPVNRTADVVAVTSQADGGRVPVTMRFVTNSPEENVTVGGCSDPIRADLVYQDFGGSKRTFSISDLNEYLVSGGFGYGETAVIKFLAPNLSTLHYVELEPVYSAEKHTSSEALENNGLTDEQRQAIVDAGAAAGVARSASWKLESVSCEIGEEGKTRDKVERIFNQVIYENNPFRANLSGISISTTVRYNGSSYIYAVGEDVEVLTESRKPIYLEIDKNSSSLITGSFEDVTVKAEKVVDSAASDCSALLDITTSRNSRGDSCVGGITFNTPKISGSAAGKYRVTITSKELPSVKLSVNVTVEPEQTQEAPEQEQKENEP